MCVCVWVGGWVGGCVGVIRSEAGMNCTYRIAGKFGEH